MPLTDLLQVAHNRQYALPAGGLRGWAITDLRGAHNDGACSSTTHLPASENRHSALPFCRPYVPALGAKLGAIRCGLLRTAMDHHGQRTVWFRTVWTAVDFYGRSASIYGSEGWGFEFLRACQRSPCGAWPLSRGGRAAFRENRPWEPFSLRETNV